MNAKRLLKLAEFLKTVPKKRFQFNVFVGKGWGGKSDLSCGTTACALGWGATIPAFQKAGLKLQHHQYDSDFGVVSYKKPHSRTKKKTGFQAGAEFFDITWTDCEFLFDPTWSCLGDFATPKQVARHIEKFVTKTLKKEKRRER